MEKKGYNSLKNEGKLEVMTKPVIAPDKLSNKYMGISENSLLTDISKSISIGIQREENKGIHMFRKSNILLFVKDAYTLL